jgi:hypothetical protein
VVKGPSPFRTPPLAERVSDLRRLAAQHQWEGLDSDSVAALLTDDWSGAGPLHLDATLTLDELGPAIMLDNVRAVLQALGDSGAPPGVPPGPGSGLRLDRGVRVEPRGFSRAVRTGFTSIAGPVVDRLHWTETLAHVAGLSPPSAEGDVLLSPGKAGELFARIFRTFFRTFNLAYTDRFPELPEVQDLVPYWLWVMAGPIGAGFVSADYYMQVCTPEPQRLDAAAAPARLRHLIQKRVLDALADFGLLDVRDEREELGDVRFRPTALFKRFLRFDLAPAGPVRQRSHLNLLR